jgi:hypothetical protein
MNFVCLLVLTLTGFQALCQEMVPLHQFLESHVDGLNRINKKDLFIEHAETEYRRIRFSDSVVTIIEERGYLGGTKEEYHFNKKKELYRYEYDSHGPHRDKNGLTRVSFFKEIFEYSSPSTSHDFKDTVIFRYSGSRGLRIDTMIYSPELVNDTTRMKFRLPRLRKLPPLPAPKSLPFPDKRALPVLRQIK